MQVSLRNSGLQLPSMWQPGDFSGRGWCNQIHGNKSLRGQETPWWAVNSERIGQVPEGRKESVEVVLSVKVTEIQLRGAESVYCWHS